MRTNTAEIIRLKPDVILAQNTPMVAVLRQQTTTNRIGSRVGSRTGRAEGRHHCGVEHADGPSSQASHELNPHHRSGHGADPVGDGLVASLARPGGNVTGTTFLGPELVGKRLQLLKEVVPGLSRVAALWHPSAYSERTTAALLNEIEAAARTLGLQLRMVQAAHPDDFVAA